MLTPTSEAEADELELSFPQEGAREGWGNILCFEACSPGCTSRCGTSARVPVNHLRPAGGEGLQMKSCLEILLFGKARVQLTK